MHFNVIAATLLAAAPLALAQSATSPTATSTASGKVVTMMWDNEPAPGAAATSGAKKAASMSGMSMDASMTMSDGKVMSAMSGMSMSGKSMASATGTAMAGMNMTGAAGRMELAPSAMGVGWVVISLGAGIGFLAGAL